MFGRRPAIHVHVYLDEALAAITQSEARIMEALEALKQEVAGLRTDVENFVAASNAREQEFQTRLDAAVAKAMADDEIKDSAAIKALQDEIAAIRGEFPKPVFTPSANAEPA